MKIVITIDSKTASLLLKLASDSHMSISQLTTQLLTEALPKNKQLINMSTKAPVPPPPRKNISPRPTSPPPPRKK